jgi:predicted glycoside hydrolase/deacetylase ChbG (UPF0249 family)
MTAAQHLGYSPEAKLLIVHADDLGMTHAVNAASIRAMEEGSVNSGSVMVPCPWFGEIARYARSHTGIDWGLHLTLNSEWDHYRWGPVSDVCSVRSLVDADGYLHAGQGAAARMATDEVELEIRRQIERARAFGIAPTHLDSHMGMLYTSTPLFETFLKVARDEGLPVMVAREWLAEAPHLAAAVRPGDLLIDWVTQAQPWVPPDRWREFYAAALRCLRPGITEILVHVGYDNDELSAAIGSSGHWAAQWRQRDFDFFTGEECRRLLEENAVQLVTWRELAARAPRRG